MRSKRHPSGAALGLGTLLFAGLAPPLAPQSACPAVAPLTDDLEQPMAAVRYLSDDALEGRLSGTQGERCAAEYIAAELSRLGLVPAGDDGTFFQSVELQSALNAHAPAGMGMNVVGLLPGSDPALAREMVVIGAHHDHLGRGQVFGSLANAEDGTDDLHNGADDNASGVGVVIAVAEALAEAPPARSVLFATFTGEEYGLLGSAHLARSDLIAPQGVVGMVNLDMVGRLEDEPLIVNGTGTASEWDALLDDVEAEHGIPLARSPDGFGPSDHTSFYSVEIPVLHFFTNVHAEYHRPGDEWETVDTEGMDRVAELVEDVVRRVASEPAGLTYIGGAGTPPEEQSGGYGAYLGTVPDFAPVDFGVRLSGVSGGSPAESAGFRAGDVLVRLGAFEIGDLYALTEALQSIAPGTELEAVLIRDGEEITRPVTLGER